ARAHAVAAGIPQAIESAIQQYDLRRARVLDLGAGSGLLQDIVDDYVGLDVASSASRFFHKPFVLGTGSHLPFADASFDVVWSVWVLEQVANPEGALAEIRRVVANGGYVLLRPAWNCDPWAAEGYEVRPYGDFGIFGKLIKASIPIRVSSWYT